MFDDDVTTNPIDPAMDQPEVGEEKAPEVPAWDEAPAAAPVEPTEAPSVPDWDAAPEQPAVSPEAPEETPAV